MTCSQGSSSINTVDAFSCASKSDYGSRSTGVNNLCEPSVDKAVSSSEVMGGAR